MNFDVPLMDMAPLDYTLNAGNYMALFSFKLPDKISSSLVYKDDTVREKPAAKVEHKVKISLVGTGLEHKPKAKAVIVVRQPPMTDAAQLEQQVNSKITKYFCYD